MTFPRPKFVKVVRGRKGETFLYFSKAGAPRVRLTSPDGSWALLWESFGHFIASILAAKAAPTSTSFLHYIKAYERSADFLGLTQRVQTNYGAWIRAFKADLGDLDAATDITPAFLMDLRDAWAARGYEAANTGLKVLKPIIDRARIAGVIEGDPMSLVPKVERPHDKGEAHPIWTEGEFEACLEWCMSPDEGADGPRRPGLARALALGRYAGFRRQTICAVPRAARVLAPNADGVVGRRIVWMTEKKKVLADKPEDSRLTEVLRKTASRSLFIAYNDDGEPWKERQLNQAITRLLERLIRAGDERVRFYVDASGEKRSPLTIHGLRHSRGVELAEAGASDAQIMAQIDHATTRAASIYRRQAERRGFADAGQAKVDNVISIAERKAAGGAE